MNDASKPIKAGVAKTKNEKTAADAAGKSATPVVDPTVALPSICNLPLPRNPFFTGREKNLSEMATDLNADSRTVSPQALKGVGGIGKTQIALEFAYRHASDYQAIWWIRAEDKNVIALDYTRLAAALHLEKNKPENPEATVGTVRHWLEKNRDWLVIFDNVKKPEDIHDYLPREAAGHVIITSRHQVWEPWYRSVSVDCWPRDESESFLTRRTDMNDSPGAAKIAEALGDLPIALEQAGAYINCTDITFADYLTLFNAHHRMRWENVDPPLHYPDTVGTTASLAIEKVQEKIPAGALILNLCSFLASTDISFDAISGANKHVSEELSESFTDPAIFGSAIKALKAYALAEAQKENLSIHHLIQIVVRDRLTSAEQQLWSTVAVRALNSVFPDDDDTVIGFQPEFSSLLYHGQTAVNHANSYEAAPETQADLMDKIGVCLHHLAFFPQAESFFQKAIKTFEAHLGGDHPDVAAVVSNLATLYRDQNRHSEAEPLFRQALKIMAQRLGDDHPDAAISLNNLAMLLHDQGKDDEAETLLRKALEISEKQLGADNITVAGSTANLGLLLYGQYRYDEAESLLRRTLAINEKQLGNDHPQMVVSLNNLAVLLHDQGKDTEAETLLQRALEINETRMGSNQLGIATSLVNLAMVLQDRGEYAQAETLHRKALKIRKKQLGDAHPDIAASLRHLAELFHDQGKYSDAQPLYRRAISILEEKTEYTEFNIVLNNLALLFHERGEYTKAEPLYRRAVEIGEKQLGADHPDVATSLTNLALLFHEQGEYAEAEPLCRQALEIREKQLGADHPDVATSISNLAELLKKQEEVDATKALLGRIPVYYTATMQP